MIHLFLHGKKYVRVSSVDEIKDALSFFDFINTTSRQLKKNLELSESFSFIVI